MSEGKRHSITENEKGISPYLLMQMVITPLMGLKLIDPTIAFAAEIAVESFSGFAC